MLKTERINNINEYVHTHQTVSLDTLMTIFNVSKNTIRRDIQQLVKTGAVKKIYGGVSAVRTHSELLPFTERTDKNHHAKKKIASLAAPYLKNGDVVFIDSGTTTAELIHYINDLDLTIVTNNIPFILEALPYENLTIYSIGGQLNRKTNSFAGFESIELLQNYNINKAFIASTGLSLQNGVTNSSPAESMIKSTAVKRSSRVFLMVDSSKFDTYALTTFCPLKDIDTIITNQKPTDTYLDYANEYGIDIVF